MKGKPSERGGEGSKWNTAERTAFGFRVYGNGCDARGVPTETSEAGPIIGPREKGEPVKLKYKHIFETLKIPANDGYWRSALPSAFLIARNNSGVHPEPHRKPDAGHRNQKKTATAATVFA